MWYYVLGGLLLLSVLFSIIQVIRVKALEEVLEIELTNRKQIQEIIERSSKVFNSELKEAFNNDDEVGIFFSEIEEIQEELNSFVRYLGIDEKESE